MWRRIRRMLVALGLTVGGIVAFLVAFALLIDYSTQAQQRLAVDQARLDVMVAGEIYEAKMTAHMEICMSLGAPPEMCLMVWVSGGQR